LWTLRPCRFYDLGMGNVDAATGRAGFRRSQSASHLNHYGVGGVFARLDLADRDLSALCPGHEPVAPQQQRPPVPDDDAARAGQGPDQTTI
jgi:hypothetical protein